MDTFGDVTVDGAGNRLLYGTKVVPRVRELLADVAWPCWPGGTNTAS